MADPPPEPGLPEGLPPAVASTGPAGAASPTASDDAGWLGPPEAMPPWVRRAMVWFFVGVVALAVGSWLLGKLRDLIITLLIALFMSFALEPAVNYLAARGWRRGTATGVVFVVFVLLSAVFIFAIGKVVFDEVQNLVDNAPGYIEDGESWINDTFGTNLSSDTLSDQLSDTNGPFRTFISQAAGNAVGLSFSAVGVVFRLFTIALFVFYLVADGPRFRRVVCSFLRPARQRIVLDTWEIAIQKTGGYIYSRGLLAILSGLFHCRCLRDHRHQVRHRPRRVGGAHVAVHPRRRHLHGRRPARCSSLWPAAPPTPCGCWPSPSPTSRSRTTCSPPGSPPAPWRCTRRLPSAP